jgi:hypothetical protein
VAVDARLPKLRMQAPVDGDFEAKKYKNMN